MGNTTSNNSMKEILQYDNLSEEDKEELNLIDSYKNQLYLNNFTKTQVKQKIEAYINIHKKTNRHFNFLHLFSLKTPIL
jgi:hypothetical protein